MNKSNDRLYNALVFVTIIFSLVFTSVAYSTNLSTDYRSQIGILKFDPDLNSKEMLRCTMTKLDDVCDDCGDDDDSAVNKEPIAYISKVGPNPAHEFEDVSFEGYGEDEDGTVIAYAWLSDIDDIINDQAIFTTSELSSGLHMISFYVQDDKEAWSQPAEITLEILQNQAPIAPVIAGNIREKAGEECDFDFITTDPEQHDVFYYVDWGDGSTSEWAGPTPSDQEFTISHTWERGSYEIRAKAKDIHDAESDWSDPFGITLPKFKFMETPLFRILELYLNLLRFLR
jgi:hypothetical protein